jgi:DNA-directed RNA polymerase subunit RPC12/RpoP
LWEIYTSQTSKQWNLLPKIWLLQESRTLLFPHRKYKLIEGTTRAVLIFYYVTGSKFPINYQFYKLGRMYHCQNCKIRIFFKYRWSISMNRYELQLEFDWKRGLEIYFFLTNKFPVKLDIGKKMRQADNMLHMCRYFVR